MLIAQSQLGNTRRRRRLRNVSIYLPDIQEDRCRYVRRRQNLETPSGS